MPLQITFSKQAPHLVSSICHSSDSLKKQWEVEHSPNTSHTKPSCKSEVSLPPNSHLRPCFASAWHVGACFSASLGDFKKWFLRYFSKRFESMLDKGLHHVMYIFTLMYCTWFFWAQSNPHTCGDTIRGRLGLCDLSNSDPKTLISDMSTLPCPTSTTSTLQMAVVRQLEKHGGSLMVHRYPEKRLSYLSHLHLQ